MPWLKTIANELFGLFVDDGTFAITILAWLALAWLTLPHLPLPPTAKGPILFLGLAAILLESATRRARH